MTDKRTTPGREGFSTEPEIIPPERDDRRREGDEPRIWISVNGRRFDRAAFVSPGPLTVMLAALTLGILAVVATVLLLGAFLVWIPLTVVLAAGLILSAMVRSYFRRRL